METEVSSSVVAALFGLDGFCVLAAADVGGELELLVETIARVVPCPDCGVAARAKDRRAVWVRDLSINGRPVVVCWNKRVWSCPHTWCPRKTWTEQHSAIQPRACLTERARAWAFDQVGVHDDAVSRVACTLGVALSRWWGGWKDSVGEQRVDGVVQGSSVPDGDHQPLRVAVFPVSAEFS